MSEQRYVVTGGFGFIGSHLVEALAEAGHEVVIVDNLFSSQKNTALLEQYPTVSFQQVSILDTEAMRAIIQEGDVICHLAAHFGHPRSLQDPLLNVEVNVKGIVTLLEIAKEKKVERFIFASTVTVYGDPESVPLKEDFAPHPKSPYDISKLAGENYVLAYHKLHGLKTTVLRFANAYGPRDPIGKYRSAVSNFISKILNDEAPTLHFEGKATRDFIHVKDIVQAIMLAATKEAAVGQVFNVCTQMETTIKDLVDMIIRITGSSIKPKLIPGEAHYSSRLFGSREKITSLLGFEPKIPLEQGLVGAVEWCKAHPEFMQPQPYSYT